MAIKSLFTKKKIWIPILAVILLAGAGFGIYKLTAKAPSVSEAIEEEVYTATIKRGDITLSATGSGTLVAEDSKNLKFTSDGTVEFVNVQVGDVVEAGDVLAKLDDTSSLESDVTVKELELLKAQQELENLKTSAQSALGEAQLAVAEAQEAYEEAQSGLIKEGMVRCDEDSLDAYYQQYLEYQKQIDDLGETNDPNYYLNVIYPVEQLRDQAKAKYNYCAGYTEYEISASEANLTITEAALKEAQEQLTLLEENDGLDPDELALAENEVKSAEIAYEKAVEDLEGATLVAPFDGTIMSVAGKAGDSVDEGSTFISIADLNNPYIDFYIDETDMDMVAIGYEAEVSFDALPDQTFKGTVTQVDPALSTSNGYTVLHGTLEIQADLLEGKTLIEGMSATVEIIGGSTENALLVPVEALRDLGDGEYAVFLLDAAGEPKLTPVEIGLMDYTYAEVLSGLDQGDVVTTGIVETEKND